jgi:hypothetical protein
MLGGRAIAVRENTKRQGNIVTRGDLNLFIAIPPYL